MAYTRAGMNALYNCHNEYQTKVRKVLCVCSAGLLRSPTAAKVLAEKYGFNTRACGVESYALIPLSDVLVEWADTILFMEEVHLENASFRLSEAELKELQRKSIVLGIPDMYEWNDPVLQDLILKATEEIFTK
jgi:predicted protein tyrosine phosphatase